jgi:putative ABC transport system permease protein
MSAAVREVRLAFRSLAKSPVFFATTIITLAVAIGASTAAFGVLDAIRFRALPFRDADRLLVLGEVDVEPGRPTLCPTTCLVSYETFADVLRATRFQTLDEVAANVSGGKAVTIDGDVVLMTGGVVSPNLFAMLGETPRIGRTFSADDDRLGVPLVTVLSHELWTRLGSDPGILGTIVKLSDSQYTVIGVMPPGFRYEVDSQFWLPVVPTLDPSTLPSIRSVAVVARLAPGRTLAQARSELAALSIPARDGPPTVLVASPLRDRYIASTQSHDVAFAVVVGCILLIACANLSNLVLVRTLGQHRDYAIRAALGAGVATMTRGLLAQNLLLVAIGACGGAFVASRLLGVLQALPVLASLRPDGMEYRMDARVLLFATVVALVAAALMSVVPAVLVARTDVRRLLQAGSGRVTAASRVQRFFVVAQIATAAVLLSGAALMARTVLRLGQVDAGFDAAHVVNGSPSFPHPWRVADIYLPVSERIVEALNTLPGVHSAALRAAVPLGRRSELTLEGSATPLERVRVPSSALGISPGYFETMGIAVKHGRAFDDHDRADAVPVAIVNEWTARNWWPGLDPIGRTIRIASPGSSPLMLTVVGVIADNKAVGGGILSAETGPELYRPWLQASSAFPGFIINAAAPSAVERPMRELLARMVPDRPLVTTVASQQIASQLGAVRTNARQIAAFALIGLFLAAIGIHGLLSWAASQRTREMAIRGAIGASRIRIAGLILGDAARLTALGLILGLPAARLAVRWITDMLHGTRPGDPLVYGVVSAGVFAVALLASWVPVRRVTRVDPLVALRDA